MVGNHGKKEVKELEKEADNIRNKIKDITSQYTKEMQELSNKLVSLSVSTQEQTKAEESTSEEEEEDSKTTPSTKPTTAVTSTNGKIVGKLEKGGQLQSFNVKLSGGENKDKFDGKGQKFIERKLTALYPGRIIWSTKQLDYIVIPNHITQPSISSNSKLHATGRYMKYDDFIVFMNGSSDYKSFPKMKKETK
jgi:hypothetical protein